MELKIDKARMPRHVAIIMDGNGRWAEQHGLPVNKGHEAGVKPVRISIAAARELELEAFTLYAFSTENWSRPPTEVNNLFSLMSKYARLEIDHIDRQGMRIRIMGRYWELNNEVVDDLEYCIERTKNNTGMQINIAINYGGRLEIADAARAIAEEVQAGKLRAEDIDEECVARHLYVPELPDIDLLIRTSGELRVSNFMLWQLSYAEFVSLPVLWPDFRRQHLREAVAIYQQRSRRFGGRQS